MNVSQVPLLVEDFAGCYRFYRQALGLESSFGDESSGYASLATDSGTVAVFERKEQNEVVSLRGPGDSALVVLEVDDVDEEPARLGEHVLGQPVDRPDWDGRVVYLRDPDGNLVELFQPIPVSHE